MKNINKTKEWKCGGCRKKLGKSIWFTNNKRMRDITLCETCAIKYDREISNDSHIELNNT